MEWRTLAATFLLLLLNASILWLKERNREKKALLEKREGPEHSGDGARILARDAVQRSKNAEAAAQRAIDLVERLNRNPREREAEFRAEIMVELQRLVEQTRVNLTYTSETRMSQWATSMHAVIKEEAARIVNDAEKTAEDAARRSSAEFKEILEQHGDKIDDLRDDQNRTLGELVGRDVISQPMPPTRRRR